MKLVYVRFTIFRTIPEQPFCTNLNKTVNIILFLKLTTKHLLSTPALTVCRVILTRCVNCFHRRDCHFGMLLQTCFAVYVYRCRVPSFPTIMFTLETLGAHVD